MPNGVSLLKMMPKDSGSLFQMLDIPLRNAIYLASNLYETNAVPATGKHLAQARLLWYNL